MQLAHIGLPLDGHGHEHRAHLMQPVAKRACNARHADADIRAEARAHALRHGLRHLIADGALLADKLRVDAEQARLGVILIRHESPDEEAACAGKVGEALGDLAAGAAFRRGEGHGARRQRGENALLQIFHIHAVDILAQALAYALHHGAQHLLCRRLALRLGRDLKQAVALLCVGGHAGVFHEVHLAGEHIVHGALADAEDVDRVRHYQLIGKLAQVRQRTAHEHGIALLRRAGQHHDYLPILDEGTAGRGAAGVVEYRAALRQHGL